MLGLRKRLKEAVMELVLGCYDLSLVSYLIGYEWME